MPSYLHIRQPDPMTPIYFTDGKVIVNGILIGLLNFFCCALEGDNVADSDNFMLTGVRV